MTYPTKTTLILITLFTMTVTFSSPTSADKYRFDVSYDLVVDHSYEIQYIADELKDCFRQEFRHSKFYGKLRSKAGTIKHRAHRLHRYGVDHGNCKWEDEIHRIDRLVCDLSDSFDATIAYSRHGHGHVSGNAIRTARKLIRKLDYHVAGLKNSIRRVEYNVGRPAYVEPSYGPVLYEKNLGQPIIEQYAPSYAPNSSLNFGVYHSGKTHYKPVVKKSYTKSYSNRNAYTHSRKSHGKKHAKRVHGGYGQSHYGKGHGNTSVALQIGGFKIHLNK